MEKHLGHTSITANDILAYGWQENESLTLRELARTLTVEAKRCEDQNDQKGYAVYRLMAAVCSFFPNFDATGNPFGPWWHNLEGIGSRSIMAEDLFESDITALIDLIPHIKSAETRARVADVAWECRKRSHQAGDAAVNAYLELADTAPGHAGAQQSFSPIRRAVQIAAKMGRNKDPFMQVLKIINNQLNTLFEDVANGTICMPLINLLCDYKVIPDERCKGFMIQCAEHYERTEEFDAAEECWITVARLCGLQKDEDAVRRFFINSAECIIKRAEAGLSMYGDSFASGWIARALMKLRQYKAAPSRIKEVHLRLLSLQRQSLNGLSSFGDIVSQIPGFLEQMEQMQADSVKYVSDASIENALAKLANFRPVIDSEELKRSVLQRLDESPWFRLGRQNQLDRQGKVVDVMDEIGFMPITDDVLKKRMLEMARESWWPVAVTFWIEPMRSTIAEEHGGRLRDLAFLVQDNPLIPSGHHILVLRGLQAGLLGDWPLSMHFLIPQVEAVLRHVIDQKNGVTASLKEDKGNLVQADIEVNNLFWLPEVEAFFGPDALFDLRGILIEKFGYNLRNEMAHGLLDAGGFYSVPAIYFWWLFLKICWAGHGRLLHDEVPGPDAPGFNP